MKPAMVEVKIADLDVFKAFVERIEEFVTEYAWHNRWCAAIDADGDWHRGNPACTCGYDEARATLTEFAP